MHHQEQDARSLALHTAAIEMMQADESLIQQALDRLARWDTHVSTCSKPLRDEWVRILHERDWALALSVSERGNQLRQASPVSCVQPNEHRLAIIRATSKWQKNWRRPASGAGHSSAATHGAAPKGHSRSTSSRLARRTTRCGHPPSPVPTIAACGLGPGATGP